MRRGTEVKIFLLVLIGVVFLGCSSIRKQVLSNNPDFIERKIKSTKKNTLNYISRISFSDDGRYLNLKDSDNFTYIFDMLNLTLLYPKYPKKSKKKSKYNSKGELILGKEDVYDDEGYNVSTNYTKNSMGMKFEIKKQQDIGKSTVTSTSEDFKNRFNLLFSKDTKDIISNKSKKIKALINKDGSVSLFSKETNKKLLTIKLFKNQNRGKSVTLFGKKYENRNSDSWLAITPEGYYVGSPDAYRYFDIDKYYENFYRPEIVKLALQGESIEGLPNISDIKSPPKVEILNGVEETDKESIELKVAVKAKSGGVGKIQILRNGTTIAFETKAFRREQQTKEAFQTYTVQLAKGENEIKALAFDSTNSVSEESNTYKIRSTYTKPHKKNIYALVIGVEKFNNKRFDLQNTIADAKLFTKTLMSQKNNGLFYDVNVVTLTKKEETTKANILKELKKMRKIHPEDLFVLYMGSHGEVNDDGKYYLIPSDIDDDSSQSIKQYAISEDDIKEFVGNVPSAQKFIVFDTCKAGSIANTLTTIELLKANKGVDDKTALSTLSHAIGNGAMIMGASTAREVANEKYKGHGLFTYVLVEGLNGKAEVNGDKEIQSFELKSYVFTNVKAISEKEMPRVQTPIINDTGESFSLSRIR